MKFSMFIHPPRPTPRSTIDRPDRVANPRPEVWRRTASFIESFPTDGVDRMYLRPTRSPTLQDREGSMSRLVRLCGMLVATLLAAVVPFSPAVAQIPRDVIVVGMEAEPPGLDPGQALGLHTLRVT